MLFINKGKLKYEKQRHSGADADLHYANAVKIGV